VNILIIDVGGTHVKVLVTGRTTPVEIPSGPDMTARKMVVAIRKATADWNYDAVSIGYPGPVLHGSPVSEPHNLGSGWVGFDFSKAFARPVKIINDAAMQALGSYHGGRMLFLGLGTGLGSSLIVDGVLEPMELAHLPYEKGRTYEDYVGLAGLKRLGKGRWRKHVAAVVKQLKTALQADYVVLGGGNAKLLKQLPPGAQLGDNANAFRGGYRLWQEPAGAGGQAFHRLEIHSRQSQTISKPARTRRGNRPSLIEQPIQQPPTSLKTDSGVPSGKVVFLFDVDNTLLDNDRVTADLKKHLEREVGSQRAQHYWALFEQLRNELGYADYLGALQRYRNEYPRDPRLLIVSRFLVNYPFANRLFPNSLDVIEHVKQWGTAVILSDGDVVFQPRKVDRSGLGEAVHGNVLIYVHKEKELDDVELRYPADHYVLIDDKLRILSSVKKIWGPRVTTVFPRQGHYALDPQILANYPPGDVSIGRIGDLLNFDVTALMAAKATSPPRELLTQGAGTARPRKTPC
jgi:FMN phosphatase YigB (HAD superfamily)